MAALLVAAAVLWKSGFLGPRTAAAAPSRVVAIVEFKNLSQNAADAWLAPALTAMLGTVLGASDQIRVVPGELMRTMPARTCRRRAPAAYSRDTLALLRKRLNADYVVTGGYLIGPAGGDRALRVDINLVNARSGERRSLRSLTKGCCRRSILWSIRRGAALRGKLGARYLPRQSQ